LISTTAAGATTNYSYDGDGNRLQAASSAQTTNYLWDVNADLPRLAIERDGSGSPLRSYAYGVGLLSMLAGGAHHYFHSDALGSIRNVTSSGGQTEWTYSYEPFGAAQVETKNDPMAPDNTVRFAGELLDSDSALYYLRARTYDQGTSRFLSLDPRPGHQTKPSEGSYVYALDNPATWVDPSGLGAVRGESAAGPNQVDPRTRLLTLKTGNCMPSYLPPLSGIVLSAWVTGYVTTCLSLRGKLLDAIIERIKTCNARCLTHLAVDITVILVGGGVMGLGVKVIANAEKYSAGWQGISKITGPVTAQHGGALVVLMGGTGVALGGYDLVSND